MACRSLPKKTGRELFDVWMPALAPSLKLWDFYQSGRISWKDFSHKYLKELHSTAAQDVIKPLALMSLRRPVVLICECVGSNEDLGCPALVLARALEECRKTGDFVLSFPIIWSRAGASSGAEGDK